MSSETPVIYAYHQRLYEVSSGNVILLAYFDIFPYDS